MSPTLKRARTLFALDLDCELDFDFPTWDEQTYIWSCWIA